MSILELIEAILASDEVTDHEKLVTTAVLSRFAVKFDTQVPTESVKRTCAAINEKLRSAIATESPIVLPLSLNADAINSIVTAYGQEGIALQYWSSIGKNGAFYAKFI